MTMPNTREKLIELLSQVQYLGGLEEKVADHLIANGVTVQAKKEKPPTDLTKKCGSCVYAVPAKFGKRERYVECTNAEHLQTWRNLTMTPVRQMTNPCCKCYEPKGE